MHVRWISRRCPSVVSFARTLECCCVHQDIVPGFMWMKAICVSGFHHMNIPWISGLYYESCSLYVFQNVVVHKLFQIWSWNSCKREKSGFVTLSPCFRGFYVTKQYLLPYVSNSSWIWLWVCFLLLLLLFTYCIVHSLKHMLS